MKDKLDVPQELAHLVEKREGGDRRRSSAPGKGDASRGLEPNPEQSGPPRQIERRRKDRRSS
ncbi:MAG: hypothetical protein IT424_03375 [Pirellulales bacterium]|nr:hypothetical protein [Pirellulales bacterium]